VSPFDSITVQAVLPEILILILGLLILILDPFWKNDDAARRVRLGWLAAGGLFATLIISVLVAQPGEAQFVFGGMVRFDWFGFLFKMFFIFGAAITALFMMDSEVVNKRAESYVLLLASTLGMSLMASSADLVMLYLAIETTSIPLYVLAGFLLDDKKSTEAGFKYLLFGAFTSAILLYGFSLLYGFTGQTSLYALSGLFTESGTLAFGVIILLLIGLGFKVSFVPFHFWAPDTYEGAPTPIAGFLSTASKAAGFAVLMRLFVVGFPDIHADWAFAIAVLASLSMVIGNLIALAQNRKDGSLKRLLAYSSVAHAGYAAIGFVAYTQLGVTSVVFYLLAYLLTNLAAFGAIAAFSRHTNADEMSAYYGLSRRSPALAFVMLVAFLSLAGMPPFGGFVGKVFVFAAAIQAGWFWLAFVGILTSIVGLYYYLTVLKYVYLYPVQNEEDATKPLPISRPYAIALTLLCVAILLVGTVFAPWFDLSTGAALTLF
jgi:NADH-quinone oxidoreductase subunit N